MSGKVMEYSKVQKLCELTDVKLNDFKFTKSVGSVNGWFQTIFHYDPYGTLSMTPNSYLGMPF